MLVTPITAKARCPGTFAPVFLAGVWITGIIVGAGRGVPLSLSRRADGPVWWISTAAATCFATFLVLPKLPYLRTAALLGLAALAITYAGPAAIEAIY